MASGSVRPATSSLEGSASADKLIDAQLGRVRRHIRITDLIAGIMALFAGVFAFLIVVAIVDHWILGLGVVGRVLALGALLAGAGWHLTMNVVPLLVRKINPAYAAQTIERGGPNLKNSLLNYLLLRRQSAGMHAVVFQAVQQRAAADVSRVEVEQTVDRSTLIRAGYVLAGVMVIAAAYKILSPKDPFQTVRRIAAPWSDIARPARVTIEGVEPGNAEVIQGHSVDVSVLVRGERATDEVRLIFSSLDGQIVDQSVLMKPDSAGLRHLLAFPPGGSGVQQDYIYRISAGDAVTTTYRLRSVPAPTMTIESVQYEFPAYTQRAREVVERVGDLKAVEGTRVTVRGKANQPIRNATIEFMSVAGTGKNSAPNERVPMQFREREAWFSWTLQLANDRQTPKHSAYQATFVNQSGLASRDPVLHRIEVVPDLSPEVEILTPNKDMVQVPVHGQQKIEIRAIDPDFGLSNVRLKAVCAGQEILNEPLFENTPGQMGQVVVEYKFRPSALQLSAGSQVSYWAEASDNRQSDGSPQPNITQTPRRTLAIIDDPAGQPRSPEQKSDAVEKPGENGSPSPPEKTPDGDKSKQSGSREKSDNDKQSSEQEQTKNNQKSQDQPSSGSQEGSEQKSGKQSSDSKQGGSAGKGNSEAGEGQSGQKQGGESSKSDQPSPSEPGQGSSAQQKGGDTPQQNRPENSDTTPGNGPNATGESRDGGNSGQRTEPLHDGEAFEKALERLKQKPNDPNQDSPSESPENQKGENQKGTNQDGQQGSSPHERQPNGQEATGTDSSQSQGGKSTEKSVTKKQSSGSNGSQKGPAEKSDGAGSQGSRKTDRPQSGGDQQQSTSEKTTSSEQKDKQKSGADDKQPGDEESNVTVGDAVNL